MRNPELYTEKNTGSLNDVTIKLEDAKREIMFYPSSLLPKLLILPFGLSIREIRSGNL